MKSMKVLLFLTMLLIMFLAFTISEGEALKSKAHAKIHGLNPEEIKDHFTGFRQSPGLTCATNPSICLDEGSAGHDCCSNKCVNMATDSSNCGKCGKECGHKKMCCEGKCVHFMTNKHHCGNCDNKCGKGSSCVHGMCRDE